MPLPTTFSLDSFVQGAFEGKNDTRYLRLEAPKVYRAQVIGPFGEERKTKLRVTDKGQLILDVVWLPEDEEQRMRLGVLQLPTARQSVFLDVTAQGGLDMSEYKNGSLGRLREALDLNREGQRWGFADFVGKTALIKVENSPNEADPMNPYQSVNAVTHV